MKLIVVTGMPASGKNIVCQYARKHGHPYFSTGDIVREEILKRGGKGDPETSARISTELRGSDGLGVTRMAVARVLEQKSKIVFLEGIRSWPEIEMIRSKLPARWWRLWHPGSKAGTCPKKRQGRRCACFLR